MAVDEATRRFMEAVRGSGMPAFNTLTPEQARAIGAASASRSGPGEPMERVSEERLVAPGGTPFSVRILTPVENPTAVIVFYHGGGWVLGDMDGYDTLARHLAVLTSAAVVLVNYRLAPESPYPGPVEDAWAALGWVAENLSTIAGGLVPLVVAGDSAGGALAAVMTHRARAQGAPAISLQVLVYPATDSDLSTDSYLDPENQQFLDRDTMVWFWDHYAPVDRRSEPEASPLRADDFSALPPAIVVLAEHDPLHDEGLAYASALRHAGVPVREKVFTGQMHGFFSLYNVLPASALAIQWIASEVTSALSKESV